jgi:hypothetical protein
MFEGLFDSVTTWEEGSGAVIKSILSICISQIEDEFGGADTTRPDLSTMVTLLAQHQSYPSFGHLVGAHYAVRYLANTETLGIYFTSMKHSTLEFFLHFPLPNHMLSMSDANWGSQDASQS